MLEMLQFVLVGEAQGAKVVRILMKNGPKKMPPHNRTSGDLRFCVQIAGILAKQRTP